MATAIMSCRCAINRRRLLPQSLPPPVQKTTLAGSYDDCLEDREDRCTGIAGHWRTNKNRV